MEETKRDASPPPPAHTGWRKAAQKVDRRARWWSSAGSAVLLLGGLGGGYSLAAPSAADSPERNAQVATAEVERRDLAQTISVTGSLGFGALAPVVNQRTGVLTSVPEPGTVVAPGELLYTVDGRPVVAMAGAVPAWRALKYGVDDGSDIAQVEQNLVDLGFADPDELTVDSTWTWATTAAVERWQESLGLEKTGTIEFGQVVFVPDARRVSTVEASPGQSARPGATVLSTTSLTRTITVELDVRRQHLVEPEMEVSVTLPDGTIATATVTTVGSVATTPVDRPDEPPTVTVTLTFNDPSAAGSLDGATVKVAITTGRVTGVLAVPVNALLATASDGYAVEVVRGDRVEVVPVTLGLFADGWVELASGDISEGAHVVVPS